MSFTNRDPYQEVRSSCICPLCSKEKGSGLLVCWPCYNLHNLRETTPEAIAAQLDKLEAEYRAITAAPYHYEEQR